jgi:hypothetical protein
MRGRIVLFVILAIVTTLVGVWLGWSTTTPKAVGEPATATPADAPVGPTQRRSSGAGPSRTPTPSLPKATPPKATPPKGTPPKACSPQAAAQPAAYTTASGQEPQTEPASQPQPSTDPVRLGKVTTTPSDNTADTAISEDRTALTTAFSDREAAVGNGKLTDCEVTRSFAMTLPLTEGAEGETLAVGVQGFAVVHGGARAQLTLKVNGQGTVRHYRTGFEDEVYETLELPAIPATTYQLSGVLEVHQDPDTGGTAYLSVISVDVEIR